MTTDRVHVGVVVQTHWDREWYCTREQFVARLLRVMDQVAAQLEEGLLESFLFDGQVAALEDLLAHGEPALCERVLRLVRAGRIVLGPWYVMADEFLCSGESLWRNLEIGIADARQYGNCQLVGYLPDSFGHIAQMPQVLRHFGITQAVLWRGVSSPHSEFDWVAPDGSVAGTVYLTQGYYQHPFNVGDWRGALEKYLAAVEPRALSARLLLTQGGDHLVPNRRLAESIAEFNAAQHGYTLVQESLADHLSGTLAATAGRRARVAGELRDNAEAMVLPDVLSSRRYLKLAQQTLEDRLLYEIEPLYACLDVPLPARALGQCWRTLLQQQAHDSICGCSVDAVHREMVSRFEQLAHKLDGLRHAALLAAGMVGEHQGGDGATPFADDRRATLFNPLPLAREHWQVVQVFLQGDRAEALKVTGAEAQALLLGSSPAQQFHSPLDDFPDPLHGHLYELALRCPLGGLEAKALRVERDAGAQPAHLLARPEMHNGRARVALAADGSLTINGHACWIASELDAGDSYNFAPPPARAARRHDRFRLLSARAVGAVQELRLAISARLPAALNAARSGPAEHDVDCTGVLQLRLFGDSPFVHAELDWHNAGCDQRTRLLLALNGTIDSTWADGGFAWLQRPVVLADPAAVPARREMPVAVNPSHSAIAAGPLHVAHRALPEFEVVTLPDGQQALALTLVRSTGWLSRRDLSTRVGGAGPDIATPEGQSLGRQRFDFRVAALNPPDPAALLAESAALRQPPLLLRGHSDRWCAGFELPHPQLQTSACRRVGEHTLQLRVWNPTAQRLGDVPPFGIHTIERGR